MAVYDRRRAAKIQTRQRRRSLSDFTDMLSQHLLSVVGAILCLLPGGLERAIIDSLSHILVLLLPARVSVVRQNLSHALTRAATDREVRYIARGSFRSLLAVVFGFLRLPMLSDRRLRRLVRFEGMKNLSRALSGRRGVLALTAHIGIFEWIAPVFNRLILHRPRAHLVGRRLHGGLANRIVVGLRRRGGADTVDPFLGSREVLRRLKRKECVGFALDQNMRYACVFVDFFGRKAATTPALAVYSRASGAPVLPIFAIADGWRRVTIHMGEPMGFERRGNRKESVVFNTQLYTSRIERAVRKWPEQWFWFHKRFKTRPMEEGGDGGRRTASYFESRLRRTGEKSR